MEQSMSDALTVRMTVETAETLLDILEPLTLQEVGNEEEQGVASTVAHLLAVALDERGLAPRPRVRLEPRGAVFAIVGATGGATYSEGFKSRKGAAKFASANGWRLQP
jgi:hypothetical protein